jgi:hypothetical protein
MSDNHEIEYVDIDGHRVPAHLADMFYDGRTGERITDEEWDEQRRRLREHGGDPFEEKR